MRINEWGLDPASPIMGLTFTTTVGVLAVEVAGSRYTGVASPPLHKQLTETTPSDSITGQVQTPSRLTVTGGASVNTVQQLNHYRLIDRMICVLCNISNISAI